MDTQRTEKVHAQVEQIVAAISPLRGTGMSHYEAVAVIMNLIVQTATEEAQDQFEQGRQAGADEERSGWTEARPGHPDPAAHVW